MDKSMKEAKAGSLSFDEAKMNRLANAMNSEWTKKPDCSKGAVACGLTSESELSNSQKGSGQQLTLQTDQQIISAAQKLGSQLRSSINNIETLKQGETIGNNERISEDKTTLKGLGSIDDWSPDDGQPNGFTYPTDKDGSNKALEQKIRYSINTLFASEAIDDNWEKFIAELFKDMLKAFSVGFTGLGEGFKSEIPESVNVNLTSVEEVLRSFGSLEDKVIEIELKNYVENCESIGYKDAFKQFMDKFGKK